MSSNEHAVRRARWRASPILVLAAAVIGMSQVALADELTPEAASVPPEAVWISAATEPAAPPAPVVVARIDLSEQTMKVYVDDELSYTFKVSTGRTGYGTPTGDWNPEWLSPLHRSKKYHNAPMPWSVFFHGGYAVHGTTEVRRLGRPASHGCVRLLPANAKIFYKLVEANGKANTLVSIVR